MFLNWQLSLLSFQQLIVLAAALPNSLRHRSSEDESPPAVGAELSHPDSEPSSSSLLSCSLDLIDLKEADYNTVFDGAYGSGFENAILTLCSEEGKQIPWKNTNQFKPSTLDQVAEQCCSDIMSGLETFSFKSSQHDSVEIRPPANGTLFFFFSAFAICLLYIIKSTSINKR
ncbi:hypothetical protein N7528_009752 [Penicillium herquei]|nr:hypothetical protein N7528_009752 [Penicillium herquei]